MKELRDIEYRLLFELIKNSKRSDRQLAKILGVSQATISRTRAGLKREMLLEYTAIPNFKKLGFDVMAFVFVAVKPEKLSDKQWDVDKIAEQHEAFISNEPSIIFSSRGRGLGMRGVTISVHKSYNDYVKFETRLRGHLGDYIDSTEAFLISMQDEKTRELTFRFLADYLKKSRE